MPVFSLVLRRAVRISCLLLCMRAGLLLAEGGKDKGGHDAKKDAQLADPTMDPRMIHSNVYVHSWIKFPPFTLLDLKSGEPLSFEPKEGVMNVVVFVASWCEPCQQLMPAITKLQKNYSKLNTRFVYVFTHDTKSDAEGFMKEYGLPNGLMANLEVLKQFSNPELPSIYVSDRNTWLLQRYVNTKAENLKALDEVLRLATSY